ncbi:hypothetical protein ACFQFC_02020 [Amorphoplanes digitatis]|uniref:Uncharacterized protein n=1 Tax=Actinoplanes digitatis TaxID=1868 RepID=A0A7W7HY59_9ACTN|nr:hypothetical protein [Actinoplanes digitatis]MBB4762954.1 hypothetical protein [Actinoplanes digitatis]BFE71919.1 hypothetical protein GCM10020092_052200 [Actinoplanes digitatis]GID91552.1 hypothetical protein Adi01nite_09640 [Actinoplanes digitatis]
MTTALDHRPDLISVRRGEREIGVFAVGSDRTTFVPAVDVTALALGSMAVAAVTAVTLAIGIARRRPPAIGTVTMGPGGWLSLKRAAVPPLRPTAEPRPWWARVIHAHRLVVRR